MWLARTFAEIERHSARTDITRLLTNMFRSVIVLSPNDLLPCVYLTINKVAILEQNSCYRVLTCFLSAQIAPAYEGIELGIGESILIRAVAAATGKKDSVIKAEYEKLGDLGLVAVAARNTQKYPQKSLLIFVSCLPYLLLAERCSRPRR